MKDLTINKVLPVIAIPDTVLQHGSEVAVRFNDNYANELYYEIVQNDFYALAVTVKDTVENEKYLADDFYKVGTLVKVESFQKLDANNKLLIQVLDRVELTEIKENNHFFEAEYERVSDIIDLDHRNQMEMLEYMKKLSIEISKNFRGSESYVEHIDKIEELPAMIAYLMPFMNLSIRERQAFLEMKSLRKRSLRFLDILIEQKEAIQFQMEVAAKLSDKANKGHRENMLREQMKAIQEELDKSEGSKGKKNDYRTLIANSQMPDDVREIALDEVDKLERQGANSAEANVIRNYLDLLTKLPWGDSEIKDIDIEGAREILNHQHYGLDKVKDRIIQHLIVMKLKQNKQGSILLLVGPPGTGKTSLGKSIASALEREYVRVSLGGVRDEAEIRGHRRTYIGALPGRIVQGMKRAGTKNPVFILDEVDKLMASNSGDPASALLEVLDPEQNNSFVDHYLEVPYDLSDVLFVATANSLKGIPGPLRDRMEIIDISSYTSHEKFHIAKDHLIDNVLEDHGLNAAQLQIEDEALKLVIEKYTREAGVRGLKRQLATIARVASEKIVVGKVPLPYVIKGEMLFDMLGHEIARYDRILKNNTPGVVTGMAWTPVGGDILFIEGVFMPGKGGLMLTGQLGDVMKESAKISQSLIRSRLAFSYKNVNLGKNDLHIHVPSGSIPKDGPSAGVTLFTTIASLVTGIAVDPKLAMTGEVSLRGAVMPVGGIKEKVLAAHRAGIERVILPKDNEKDIDDIPEDVRAEMKFVLVEDIGDVLREALGIELPEVGKFTSGDGVGSGVLG